MGTVYDFPYSATLEANGSTKTWVVPCTGTFKFEAWGASGGKGQRESSVPLGTPGYGAYVSGDIILNKNSTIYIYVGSKGSDAKWQTVIAKGGHNGGGNGVSDNTSANDESGGGGGGATDFRVTSGAWNNSSSLNSRIMVAAGAGGAMCASNHNKVAKGNALKADSTNNKILEYCGGTSTQVDTFSAVSQITGYAFGIGQGLLVATNGPGSDGVPGSGGGYWGGRHSDSLWFGTGGTSYISGHKGSIAIVSSTSTSPRKSSTNATCTEPISTSDTKCSEHYSGYVFTNTAMKAGDESMAKPAGGNETGHSGDGYARITIVN